MSNVINHQKNAAQKAQEDISFQMAIIKGQKVNASKKKGTSRTLLMELEASAILRETVLLSLAKQEKIQ